MKDIKITKSVINERQELQVSLLIKKWDYSKQEYHLLCNSKIEWGTLDMEITWLVNWEKNEERKQKLKYLAFQMGLYAENVQENIEKVTQDLYERYKIKSRTELSDSDLDIEIEGYRTGKFIW